MFHDMSASRVQPPDAPNTQAHCLPQMSIATFAEETGARAKYSVP